MAQIVRPDLIAKDGRKAINSGKRGRSAMFNVKSE
jgi:hypothetical protein